MVSGVGIAPAKATPEYYRARAAEPFESGERFPPIPANGLKAAITPGVFGGLMLALERYGTLPFETVAAPAIEYAGGFPLMEEFAGFIRNNRRMLEMWPTSKAFFLPNGEPPQRGQLFRAPTPAEHAARVAQVEKKTRGNRVKKIRAVRDHFYSGKLAEKIAKFSEADGWLHHTGRLEEYESGDRCAGNGDLSWLHDREAGILDPGSGDDPGVEYSGGL